LSEIVYFISDLHLGLESRQAEKEKEKLLVKFLNTIKGNAGKLFIIGDLFDYWFEYKRVLQKGFFRTFTAIQNLTNENTEVNYIIGNHDFLHRDFFEKELGVNLFYSSIETEIDGKRFFLDHGDDFVSNDLGYKIVKKILRNKTLQFAYSLIHPDLGIWLASSTSKTSRNYTGSKNYGENDGLFEAAKKKIDGGFDYVVFGHTHVKQFQTYKNGFYVNLGSWLDQPCYGKFANGKFEIIDWN